MGEVKEPCGKCGHSLASHIRNVREEGRQKAGILGADPALLPPKSYDIYSNRPLVNLDVPSVLALDGNLESMRHRQPKQPTFMGGGQMRYVICPKCGDPVGPPLKKELTCVHCGEKFPLDESQVVTGIVLFNQKKNRWQLS